MKWSMYEEESLEKHKTLLANQLETELTDEGP